MAESILTSITMAGGALNIYYDTVLQSKTGYGTSVFNMPSGWKVCIVTAFYNTYAGYNLLYPIAIFNASITTGEYYHGIIINNNGEFGSNDVVMFNSTTTYSFAGQNNINNKWSLIFAA